MSTFSNSSDGHRARLAQADAIADEIVALWSSPYDPSTLVFECPQERNILFSVLDLDGAERLYKEIFHAFQTAHDPEQHGKLLLEWHETVSMRLALWLEAQGTLYRALARANGRPK